ncbi:MAG: HD-GYP domain-containing protein [Betaproteobacteria bacterium]|nr:HD-GYP domain-containing protein [Betaproteobacteria bacterium]
MLKKISVHQVRLGMHVHELCGPWMNHPFWRTKFILTDPLDIRRLLESGIVELWIDSSKGLDVGADETPDKVSAAPEKTLRPANLRSEAPRQIPLSEEIEQAVKTCAKASKAVKSMFEEVRMGKAVSPEAANDLVEEISSSVLRNPGALISLARLKTADDYTYMHSVAVCALMIALGKQLQIEGDDLREAGMAGLLHDLGKAVMPADVLNKPGKLTAEEFDIIKNHPVEGHRILLEGKTAREIPLDVCLHHHEKIDGSGYPHRLQGEGISIFARMGAVCDVYDAITSNRPYKHGWDPAESIKKMTEWSGGGGHFDQKVFQAFVKCIGIYPTGALIRLSSGRLAVVLDQSTKSLLTPVVKVFFSTKSQIFIQPEVVDLSRPGCHEKIVGKEDAAQWGIKNLHELWAGTA